MVIEVPQAEIAPTGESGCGYIGRIPVRNLWLLMLYASELFRLRGAGSGDAEDAPDDLPDLIAEILAHAVEERQRRLLSLGYQTKHAILNRVRGRIDVLTTERRQLLARGRVACTFEALTIDTPRNRFVRSALELISRLVRSPDLVHRCRRLASDMKAMGISGVPPTPRIISADRFGRHDAGDRYMVEAAKLAYDIALPSEVAGNRSLPLLDREEHWVRKLFERAIGGFYSVVLSPFGWNVSAGQKLAWPIENCTAGIDLILPSMRTDIVLDHPGTGRRIVIDTKFNSILTSGWYREESLRSGYLYQIYAYLRSQVGRGDISADRAEGLLLHPSIGRSLDETVVMQGHRIRFMTVDLSAETSTIRAELLRPVLSEPPTMELLGA
ncbi:MAG TPA: 5-methylcytosine-specific restriction endonuclease system specificity protein McrC [Acetobacteraceae bacterium]|nr:5-methylcytosine-specific restriction endonuclease system specificity protein McrC [Acetobacteraceae bacterium]